MILVSTKVVLNPTRLMQLTSYRRIAHISINMPKYSKFITIIIHITSCFPLQFCLKTLVDMTLALEAELYQTEVLLSMIFGDTENWKQTSDNQQTSAVTWAFILFYTKSTKNKQDF